MPWAPISEFVEPEETAELNCGWRFGFAAEHAVGYGGVIVDEDGTAYTITCGKDKNGFTELVSKVAASQFGARMDT